MNIIKDKINEIETYLQELSQIIPSSFQNYKEEFKTRAACERYFEKIIESLVDLSFLIIKVSNLQMPEEDKQSFKILKENKIISEDLSEKLQNAKGMRNILAHEYGNVDNKIVFDSIKKDLIPDVKEFIKKIKKLK